MIENLEEMKEEEGYSIEFHSFAQTRVIKVDQLLHQESSESDFLNDSKKKNNNIIEYEQDFTYVETFRSVIQHLQTPSNTNIPQTQSHETLDLLPETFRSANEERKYQYDGSSSSH